MIDVDRLHCDEAGMVGKLIIGWLIALVVVGVVALDVVSIAFTRFKLTDTASAVATVAATTYRNGHDTQAACQAGVATLGEDDEAAKLTKNGCTLDSETGRFTIVLRKHANTLVAERLDFTKHYANVTATATEGPATL
jgi:hypothetical protein